MSSRFVIFSSEEEVCVYHKDETQDSFGFLQYSSLEDIAVGLTDSCHIQETSLPDFLDDNQCFETPGYVYLKRDNQIERLRKTDYYIDAVKFLTDGIDRILCVDCFVGMTPKQKACLEKILGQILSQSVYVGPTLLLPIVSEIDYVSHFDYDSDDIPWKIKIDTSSPLWIEAVSKIKFKNKNPVDQQYSYSYFCKNLLFG